MADFSAVPIAHDLQRRPMLETERRRTEEAGERYHNLQLLLCLRLCRHMRTTAADSPPWSRVKLR